MKCKACNDETNPIKAGKTKAGTQKYKCKICGKVYAQNPKEKIYSGYSEEIKKQAIKLYMEGNSSRQNFGNMEKYAPVLGSKVCEKY